VFAEGLEGEEGLDDVEGAGGAVSPEMLLSFDEFRAIMEEHDVGGWGVGVMLGVGRGLAWTVREGHGQLSGRGQPAVESRRVWMHDSPLPSPLTTTTQ